MPLRLRWHARRQSARVMWVLLSHISMQLARVAVPAWPSDGSGITRELPPLGCVVVDRRGFGRPMTELGSTRSSAATRPAFGSMVTPPVRAPGPAVVVVANGP